MEIVQVVELMTLKLFLPFAKFIFSIGGWFASLLVQIVSPEQISAKEFRYRMVSSIISVPVVMGLDSMYNFNKWIVSVLTIFFGLFMWLVLDIAKKKLPKKLSDYIDKKKL